MKQRTKNKRKSLNNLGSSAIFKYWKSAQQLQNLFNEHSDIESLPNIYLSLESLLSGKLNTHEFQSFTNQLKLNELAGKESKSRQFILDRGNDKLIGVVLSPCQLHPSSNSQAHDLFLVPARIDLDGNLHTYPQYTPWIPRMYLEPSSEDSLPIISDIESTKKIFEIFVKKEISNFSDYIKVALLCFNKATGSKFDSIEIEGYRSSTKIALKIAPKRISHDSIAKLYELLDQGKIEAGSIPSFTKNRPEKIYYKHSKPQLFKTSRLHVAHFNNDFCLSPSQRNSLYKFFRLQNNSALPVDGPPGTGKTTLIQAIIANTFVSSALLNLNTPPIVVVCGATNQSVTNVIDSLNQQNSDDLLSSRWIPNLQSYGLFCASKNQSLTNTKYHVENRQNTGYFFELLNDANIYEIEKHYLDRFNSTFDKKVKSIATATKEIFRRLNDNNKYLIKTVNDLLGYSYTEKIIPFISPLNLNEYEIDIQKLESLDTNIRYLSFQLATHYWEGKWITAFSRIKKLIENKRNPNLSLLEWRWRSMLTPCFVSTLQMSAKYFSIRHNPSPPIDFLIFDEAGQVLPEDGVALSALAKKVVTIGDTNQLKPYSTMPSTLDSIETRRHKVDRKLKTDFDGLSEMGVTSSEGSFMRLCKTFFQYRDTYGSGGSLNEHRRSVPEIVEFCNRLSYHGRLIPKRGAIINPLLPTFNFVNLKGSSVKKGSSRYNQVEAESINTWLNLNKPKICENYKNQNLSELVAIVTPFTAQVSSIKQALDKKFSSLTVGTINSLQGSEKRIILFSSVYDESDERRFMLNNDTMLLNVCVSRAKDYFVFFGNLEMLRKGKNNPSNLLFEFLTR